MGATSNSGLKLRGFYSDEYDWQNVQSEWTVVQNGGHVNE
jgi:hypothetical protein